MSRQHFTWNPASRPAWESLLARAGRCGLQQGWAYGEALAACGLNVHRLVVADELGRPLACAQVARRRVCGVVPVCFLLRGPVRLGEPAGPELETVVLREIRARLGPALLVWAPEAGHLPTRRRPVITGYTTGWVDLAGPRALSRPRLLGTWRHQLARAERAGLEVAREPPGQGLAWLLAGNEAHRRRVGYRGPGSVFLRHLAEAAARGNDLFCLLARENGSPVAGIMVVRHGAAATYEVGFADARGRELRATFLLLWQAVQELQAAGVRALDLGGLDTVRAPGVAGFKLGLAPEIVTQAGIFLSAHS